MQFDRTNTSIIGRWWWTVDRALLVALFALICMGAILVTAASPPVAQRLDLSPFYFVHRQHVFLLAAVLVMFAVSLLSVQQVRRLAALGLIISIAMLCLLPFFGVEVKGSKRWLSLPGMSVQPSEFLKPCMAVTMAWIFNLRQQNPKFPGYKIAIALFGLCLGLLVIQPDFGQSVVLSATWALQFFLAGLPFAWVLLLAGLGVSGLWGAYEFFPHVQKRIDNYLDPASGDNYQVEKSLEAFENGGFFGTGPGEGEVKHFLPDSHTDFVFSVAGEEFGTLFCLLIVFLFAFVVLRGFVRIWHERDFFVMLSVAGLLTQFGVQAIINMGVAVNLLPAKGMTLPFISYGGSSLIAVGLGMGMMLAMTRKRFGMT